jgi:hypothetical protein
MVIVYVLRDCLPVAFVRSTPAYLLQSLDESLKLLGYRIGHIDIPHDFASSVRNESPHLRSHLQTSTSCRLLSDCSVLDIRMLGIRIDDVRLELPRWQPCLKHDVEFFERPVLSLRQSKPTPAADSVSISGISRQIDGKGIH